MTYCQCLILAFLVIRVRLRTRAVAIKKQSPESPEPYIAGTVVVSTAMRWTRGSVFAPMFRTPRLNHTSTESSSKFGFRTARPASQAEMGETKRSVQPEP